MIDTVGQDLQYAARTFRRSPGFVLLIVLTIGIGVGANAAIFSVVNTVLLRPLPFARAGELLLLHETDTLTGQSAADASPANVLDWRARNRTFTGLAAFRDDTYILAGEHPERVGGAMVNANFFDVLGVTPALGRAFQPGDEQRGNRVTILGHGLWQERFGGRSDVIGQTVRLNGDAHTIVGVMPAGVDYPDGARLWTPPHWRMPDDPLAAGDDPSTQRGHAYMFVVGRLKTGVTRGQAEADMKAVGAGLERDFPNDNRNVGVGMISLRDDLVGDVRPTLLLLFAAVGLVLLIATANVAGLLIAHATARNREMAVRVALGATRGRILRQLLTESVMLSVMGGAAGVLFAMWLIGPLVAMSPRDLGVAGDVRIDVNVLIFSLAVSALVGLLFGVAPARQLLAVNAQGDLKQSARGATTSGQRRVRSIVVAAEIAVSMVLLIGAGLTIRSFIRLQQVPAGFETDGVVTLGMNLPQARYSTPAQKADFWERALASLRAVPPVERLGATSRLPLSGGNSTRGIVVDGRTDVTPQPTADYRAASPDYFRALGIPLLRGRTFRDDDRESRALVTVVSASMAQRLWPNADPLGHQIAIDPKKPMTVVGVVGDVHHASLDATVRPTFYAPYRQDPWPSMTFVLRTTASPATIAAAVRAAIWQVDKEQPVGAIRTMDEQLARSLSRRRFSVTLLTAFGLMAIALAAIGLYGVLAFVVAQRRREIGVRMALGARPRDVVADVLGDGLRLAVVGVVVGFALALAGTRVLNTFLFGTSPTDALTYATAAALLVSVAVAASVVPALRASRVDPLVALRDE
jgi:putative ABC transport system permease protein